MNADILSLIGVRVASCTDFMSLLMTNTYYSSFVSNEEMWKMISNNLTASEIITKCYLLCPHITLNKVSIMVTDQYFIRACEELREEYQTVVQSIV